MWDGGSALTLLPPFPVDPVDPVDPLDLMYLQMHSFFVINITKIMLQHSDPSKPLYCRVFSSEFLENRCTVVQN